MEIIKGSTIKLSKNFKSKEFDCKCGRRCGNTLIDLNLIRKLQLIRDYFDKPVIINSGYRCAAHNRNVGGAAKSQHRYGKAADIVVKGINPKEVAQYAEKIGLNGIGLYPSFCHVDVRNKKYFWKGHDQITVKSFKER